MVPDPRLNGRTGDSKGPQFLEEYQARMRMCLVFRGRYLADFSRLTERSRKIWDESTRLKNGVLDFRARVAMLSPAGELTPRECQIIAGLAGGLSAKELAHRLGISAKTVVSHRTRLMNKLGLRTTADLVRYAVRHSMIEE